VIKAKTLLTYKTYIMSGGSNPNPNNLSFAPSSGVLTADWIDLDDIFSSKIFYIH